MYFLRSHREVNLWCRFLGLEFFSQKWERDRLRKLNRRRVRHAKSDGSSGEDGGDDEEEFSEEENVASRAS